MFPGLGGVNPAQLKGMMKKMGVSQEDIDVTRVIMEKTDGGKIVIEPASVQKVSMQGQQTFQVSGTVHEESAEVGFSDGDVMMIVEKTGKSEEEVKEVLNETKDLAETIARLS